MENDKIHEYSIKVAEALGLGMKRMTDGNKARLEAVEAVLQDMVAEVLADRPLQHYLDRVFTLLEKANRKVAKDAPSVIGVATAMMAVDKIAKAISEMPVEEYTVEEVTKGSYKRVPRPEFRILKEQQDALNRGAKSLGLNLDESVMNDNVEDDDALVDITRQVAEAGNKTITVPSSALK